MNFSVSGFFLLRRLPFASKVVNMLRTRVNPNSRPADPDEIAAEARRWWAIMAVDRDVADHLAAFSAWLDADPAHAAAFEALCKKQDRKAWLSRLLARFAGGRRRWVEAAAVAGLAGLLVLGTMAPHPDVAVPAGMWESRTPGDGSDLQFGPATRAWVDFSGQQRTIRLDAGSVVVDAAKDPNRPMIVKTEHGSVRVVGTRFVVIVDATGTEVTVSRGKVEVLPAEAAPAAAAAVTAAQRVRITSTTVTRSPVSIADTEEVRGGWRTFNAASLADLASAIGAETGQRVVVLPTADNHAGLVSGRFRVRDGQATLALLEQAYGVRHADAPFGVTVLY